MPSSEDIDEINDFLSKRKARQKKGEIPKDPHRVGVIGKLHSALFGSKQTPLSLESNHSSDPSPAAQAAVRAQIKEIIATQKKTTPVKPPVPLTPPVPPAPLEPPLVEKSSEDTPPKVGSSSPPESTPPTSPPAAAPTEKKAEEVVPDSAPPPSYPDAPVEKAPPWVSRSPEWKKKTIKEVARPRVVPDIPASPFPSEPRIEKAEEKTPPATEKESVVMEDNPLPHPPKKQENVPPPEAATESAPPLPPVLSKSHSESKKSPDNSPSEEEGDIPRVKNTLTEDAGAEKSPSLDNHSTEIPPLPTKKPEADAILRRLKKMIDESNKSPPKKEN